ncbi:bifunctional folylpolyglutamate synthase/dihydrofolate synthase [Mesonia aestuariivivens]|uniref:Dihydrofolate synthase/folylpolyglutamate synthase n=1 Tax=Mesonia aestuariivivens TaxID=2796128 RepID=A0ABS6W4E9_9FLAO|nr:folylpolyglutamate synthase/dihydrofolate synthase family protein [Mesonia aestuariivivens]MBW2962715.1 bifunctional folylpolyglutamate synthase/dihydrofolate synthase [Mesonia aestuariivivens]
MNSYQETLDWMFQQLPMYQRQGKTAFKKDLTNILKFSERLENPHQHYKTIHVGGTNGKGSTSHMLASILQEAGYKVGLYTSPHLKDYRERIKVDGSMVSEHFVVKFIQQHQAFLEAQQLSFFEMSVAMAFQYFSKEQVDIAIIEVGLGGRLDSTNIITPEVSVITNIGLDHTQFLGNTYQEIAFEKAGIIKPNVPVVIGTTIASTKTVFEKKVASMHSAIIYAEESALPTIDCDLKGNYQVYNIRTVLKTVEVLISQGWQLKNESISSGLKHVVKNTGLRGRWDILNNSPKIICDTAHNQEGLKFVMEQLQHESFQKLHIVLGVVNDKDLSSILPLFPKQASYYFCSPNIPRGLAAEELKNISEKFQLNGKVYSSVKKAYSAANELSKNEDLIFVGGSTFTVAEII